MSAAAEKNERLPLNAVRPQFESKVEPSSIERHKKRPCDGDDGQIPIASGLERFDEAPSLSNSENGHSFLKDVNGDPRGVFVTLVGAEQDVLRMLRGAYKEVDEKRKQLGQVQRYTQNLLHYNLGSPGFPVAPGSEDRELFSSFKPSDVLKMEAMVTLKLRDALMDIGYCAPDQSLQLYLSFLKTLESKVQPPHIDFKWEKISPPDFKKRPRSFKDNYKEWVPFIALFPLTNDGMTVEVWNARTRHDVPQCEEDRKGYLIHIPYGKILLLRADVVHAGAFATSASGNPRGHFYIYKTPRGLQHPYPLANCYEGFIDGVPVNLCDHYKHSSECEQIQSVEESDVRSPLANKKGKH